MHIASRFFPAVLYLYSSAAGAEVCINSDGTAVASISEDVIEISSLGFDLVQSSCLAGECSFELHLSTDYMSVDLGFEPIYFNPSSCSAIQERHYVFDIEQFDPSTLGGTGLGEVDFWAGADRLEIHLVRIPLETAEIRRRPRFLYLVEYEMFASDGYMRRGPPGESITWHPGLADPLRQARPITVSEVGAYFSNTDEFLFLDEIR